MLHKKELGVRRESHQTAKRILLVDDSPLALRNMKKMLEEKYDIVMATSGEQALKMIPQKQPCRLHFKTAGQG